HRADPLAHRTPKGSQPGPNAERQGAPCVGRVGPARRSEGTPRPRRGRPGPWRTGWNGRRSARLSARPRPRRVPRRLARHPIARRVAVATLLPPTMPRAGQKRLVGTRLTLRPAPALFTRAEHGDHEIAVVLRCRRPVRDRRRVPVLALAAER